MTAEGAPDSGQVEFRVFVDKRRAESFQEDLGTLAAYYSGTVIAPTEKPRLATAPNPETKRPLRPFRKDMTTAIYEENSGEEVAIVTKENFKQFGKDCGKYDGTLISQAFNTILRYASSSTHTQNGKPKMQYRARGAWVGPASPDGPRRPTQADGILVSTMENLALQMTEEEYKIHGFAERSKELLNHFVQVLFTSEESETI